MTSEKHTAEYWLANGAPNLKAAEDMAAEQPYYDDLMQDLEALDRRKQQLLTDYATALADREAVRKAGGVVQYPVQDGHVDLNDPVRRSEFEADLRAIGFFNAFGCFTESGIGFSESGMELLAHRDPEAHARLVAWGSDAEPLIAKALAALPGRDERGAGV